MIIFFDLAPIVIALLAFFVLGVGIVDISTEAFVDFFDRNSTVIWIVITALLLIVGCLGVKISDKKFSESVCDWIPTACGIAAFLIYAIYCAVFYSEHLQRLGFVMAFILFIPNLIAFAIECAIAFALTILPGLVLMWCYEEKKSRLLTNVVKFIHVVSPTTIYIVGSIIFLSGGFRALF